VDPIETLAIARISGDLVHILAHLRTSSDNLQKVRKCARICTRSPDILAMARVSMGSTVQHLKDSIVPAAKVC